MKIDPGVYPDVPDHVYHSSPGAHYSILKLFARSPAHARHEMTTPSEQTSARLLGSMVHTAILEPAKFRDSYVAAPKLDRRTRVGKERWQAFLKENEGKEVVSKDDMETAIGIVESVANHKTAMDLLSVPGVNEVSVFWDEEIEGEPVRCRARLDRFCKWAGRNVVLDLKTTRDASPSGFGREAAKFKYHVQAGFYMHALSTFDAARRSYLVLAVENVPPFGVALYEVPPLVLDQGLHEAMSYLDVYARCMKEGAWPSYPDGLMPLEMPAWAFKEVA